MVMVCAVFAATGAYAQGGAACLVNKVRVKVQPAVTNAGTSLDVQVHFTNGTIQSQPAVNQGTPSPTAVVAVFNLQPPMPLNTIKRIRLIYNGNLRAPVWDMTSMHARALGNTVSAVIASAGAHQFMLAKPAFGVDTTIPGSACFISVRPIAGPARVAPGTPVQQTGPLMNAGVQQAMLAAQARPLLADGSKQSQGALNGASRTAITNSTFTGGIQPAAVPQVGTSQPMSAIGNAANPRVLAPPQTLAPTGSPSLNSGTSGNSTVATNSSLSLSSGTNQGTSRTVAPPSPPATTPLNTGSGGSGLTSFQPLVPRGSSNGTSNTGSNGGSAPGTNSSLQPPIPRGLSSGGSNTGSASGVEKPLTNADLLNLLSARTSEQAILHRIRNHPATFDVSNQARANFDRACAGIKHPGAPTSAWATEIKHVWDTMVNVVICQQTNGRGGEGACDLTPLQSSPKNTSAGPTPTDPKVPGRSKYDAITLESGATQDTRFGNWAQSGQAPNNGSPSTSQVKPAMNAVGAVYGQSGNAAVGNSNACDVTQIRLRIGTGGDDLRGGQDNLNVLIYLTDAKPRVALNVNGGNPWPNHSTHMVPIPIKPPVSPDEIRAIRLFHIADGGFNAQSLENGIMATPAAPFQIAKAFQSPDNWDMSGLVASALGNGVGLRIATYGFHRFTGSNPDLVIYIRRKVMANACGTGRPTGNSGGSGGGTGSGLNSLTPGGSGLHPVTGGTGASSPYERNLTGVLARPAMQGGTQLGQKDKMVTLALARAVPVGPKPSAPSGFTNGLNSQLIGLLRRQSAAARPFLLPPFTGGVRPVGTPTGTPAGAPAGGALLPSGTNQSTLLNGPGGTSQNGTMLNGSSARADDLNPQPYPPKGSMPQAGPSQTMSAQGSTPVGAATGSQATALAPSGPTRQQPSGGQHPAPSIMTRAATARLAQTQLCINGIGTVDGQKSGVYFSPIAGPEGTFAIQGCGFGTAPGQVYLSGVHYPNTRNRFARLGASMFPDRVTFQVPPGGWTDRQIIAQIDPNASGLYDTNNVTLVVKTANGQMYQASGFNFGAAYDFQTLASVPQSPSAVTIQLGKMNDTTGAVIPPVFVDPWLYSAPQHTLGVYRNRISFTFPGSYTFPGGTDTYQFHFAPGFRLASNGVQLFHSDLTYAECQTGGNGQYQYSYSTNGNWGVNYTSPTSVQISWQEQGCWPNGKAGDPLNYASVSAYSLWITVWGPRGVSPW
jgi:hypothetical protein